MTYKEIKNYMIERISATLEEQIRELDVPDLVDEDAISEFLWEKDYGMELAERYIDKHTEELVNDYLESVFNEIDTDDLESPF